jgi:hypothetical protein
VWRLAARSTNQNASSWLAHIFITALTMMTRPKSDAGAKARVSHSMFTAVDAASSVSGFPHERLALAGRRQLHGFAAVPPRISTMIHPLPWHSVQSFIAFLPGMLE